MNTDTNPGLKVKTLLVDIDTTLVAPKSEASGDISPELCLASLVAEKHNISIEKAKLKIQTLEKSIKNMVGNIWPFGILESLSIAEKELWHVLAQEAEKKLFMYSDAKDFLIGLKRYSDIKVYTATTNPGIIIFAKLSIGGLADKYGSMYLDGAFGGEEVHPGGKSTPEFYKALLKKTGAASDSTLMVGDHVKMDLELARAAGIKQVVLVNRAMRDDWTYEPEGPLYVKSLNNIFDFFVD